MAKVDDIREAAVPETRFSLAAELLRAVHANPGATRASIARGLGMSSGVAADTVRRLVASGLVCEGPAVATGARGRPTRMLGPHPQGPLVAVAAVAHECWEVAAVEVGGGVVEHQKRPHGRGRKKTFDQLALALEALCERYRGRVRAIVVSVPGSVSGGRLVQAPNLGWRDVDLLGLRPTQAAHLPLLAGNDATFAAIAEARRGVAMGTGSSVHIYMDSGVGGAIIDGGRVLLGANGRSGEFGHMPFGRRGTLCRCGARGCWNTILDGAAWARELHRPVPADEVSFSREVLGAARAGRNAEARLVERAAAGLGRGIAGLVNALDPEIVTVGGLAGELVDSCGPSVNRACQKGLMTIAAADPPVIVVGALGERAPLVGAAEHAFEGLLRDSDLASWWARDA